VDPQEFSEMTPLHDGNCVFASNIPDSILIR